MFDIDIKLHCASVVFFSPVLLGFYHFILVVLDVLGNKQCTQFTLSKS